MFLVYVWFVIRIQSTVSLVQIEYALLGLVREPKGGVRTHEDFYDLPVQSGSKVAVHLLDTVPSTTVKGLG